MKALNIFSMIKSLKVKCLAFLLCSMLMVSVLAMPLVQAQGNAVTWEGWTKSKNVTKGETEYKDVTNADPNDVVQVMLWHHNRQNPTAGPMANNVRVRFVVPNSYGKSHVITGISSADNAPTISDGTTVNTAPKDTDISYVAGSAKFRYNKGAADGKPECETGFAYPPDSCYATVSLPDSVVTSGVNLDTIRGGPLRGCNAHHETVAIKVVVKEKPVPPVSSGVCKAATLDVYADRKVQVTVTGTVNNAEIIGYEIDFGDGTKSNKQTADHQYAKDGTYHIVTKVNVKLADGTTQWVTSDDCKKSITFEGDKPPVVTPVTPVTTPEVLADTGPGDIAALFLASTIAGMIAYRFVWLRNRFNS